MRALDLRCPRCDETEVDVYLGKDEPISPCETCAGPRVISWAGGRAPGVHGFTPVYNDLTGKYMDADEWKQHRVAVAERQGVPVEDIVMHRQTKTEIATHADEIKHRVEVRRRKAGITADVQKEIKDTVKNHGVNPVLGTKITPPTRKAP
jgi:hypothetical protein